MRIGGGWVVVRVRRVPVDEHEVPRRGLRLRPRAPCASSSTPGAAEHASRTRRSGGCAGRWRPMVECDVEHRSEPGSRCRCRPRRCRRSAAAGSTTRSRRRSGCPIPANIVREPGDRGQRAGAVPRVVAVDRVRRDALAEVGLGGEQVRRRGRDVERVAVLRLVGDRDAGLQVGRAAAGTSGRARGRSGRAARRARRSALNRPANGAAGRCRSTEGQPRRRPRRVERRQLRRCLRRADSAGRLPPSIVDEAGEAVGAGVAAEVPGGVGGDDRAAERVAARARPCRRACCAAAITRCRSWTATFIPQPLANSTVESGMKLEVVRDQLVGRANPR